MSDATQIIRAIEKLITGDRRRLNIRKDTKTGSIVLTLAPEMNAFAPGNMPKSWEAKIGTPAIPEAFNEALNALIELAGDN